jgi:nitrite reductase (NADH) large subunit
MRGLSTERIVVVGNGMASHRFCEALVAAGICSTTHQVSVLAEEERPAYDRVNLGEVLRGRPTHSLTLAPTSWYERHDIDLRLGDPVVSVDRGRRSVRVRSGADIAYDRLVLATGSRPLRPSAIFRPGLNDESAPGGTSGVFTVRTAADMDRLQAALVGAAHIAVVGGGFIGVELAATLAALGKRVDLVEGAPHVLGSRIDCDTASAVQAALLDGGVALHLGTSVTSVRGHPERRQVDLSTGVTLAADIVVVCAGVRSRDDLALQCGLARSPGGGVRVNRFLETSDPHVYAIGECAALDEAPVTQALPGFLMADALAHTMLGKRTRLEPLGDRIQLRVPGLALTLLGDTRGLDATSDCHSAGGVSRRVWVRRGRVVGATILGGWSELPDVEAAIKARARINPAGRSRFCSSGSVLSVLPSCTRTSDAMVCTCRGVTAAQIRAAVLRGCADATAVRGETGASSVCGTCLPQVEALVRAPDSVVAPAPREPATAIVACVAAVAAATILVRTAVFGHGIPYGLSLLSRRAWEVLWLTRTGRLASGFTLLALLALPSTLSARKRVSRLRWGRISRWRFAHVLLGALAVVALVGHTGLHFGRSLNRTLAVSTTLLLLVGGLAGTTPLPRATHAWTVPLRNAFRSTHVAIIAPVVTLLVAHVLAAFYF